MVNRTGLQAIQAYANASGLRQTKAPASSAAKKWHPGHYVFWDRGSSTAPFSQRKAIYDAEASIPQIAGYGLILTPASFITGVVNGVVQYTTAPIIQDLNYLQGLGKYLVVDFATDIFSGTNNPAGFWPAFLYQSSAPGYAPQGPTYIWTSGVNMTRAAEWNSYVTGVINALMAWLASATGGNLDAHPALEGLTFNDETWTTFAGKFPGGSYTGGTVGPVGSNNYSDTLWNAGQLAMLQNHGAVWKQTNAMVSLNFLPIGAAATYTAFAQAMLAAQCAFSGPDTLLGPIGIGGTSYPYGTAGQAVYSGALGSSYQGVLPGMWQVQPPDYAATPNQILTYANVNKFTHLLWWRVTGGGGDYTSIVKPLIQSTPLQQTAYPSGYPH